jgi:hypothetical protein
MEDTRPLELECDRLEAELGVEAFEDAVAFFALSNRDLIGEDLELFSSLLERFHARAGRSPSDIAEYFARAPRLPEAVRALVASLRAVLIESSEDAAARVRQRALALLAMRPNDNFTRPAAAARERMT